MSEQRHLTWVAAAATFLTAICLSPLFQEQPWMFPAFVVVAVVALVGYGARMVAFPAVVVVLAQVVAAGLTLTYQFGPGETRWWGLPTWDTIRALDALAVQGQDAINRFAPPVPVDEGVVLLTVIGIAVVAIAVDLLAVGLRLVPLAGLPLLALYTVPVAVAPDGVPWPYFVLAAGAFVGLLVAEGRERLSRWGRSMGFSEHEVTTHAFVGEVETTSIARVGRRIGAATVCLAVAVPVVVPFLDDGLISGDLGTGGGGGRTVVTGDPFADLARDLKRDAEVELFTYTTRDPSPDYFRMATLDLFDGTEWRRADRPLPDDQIIEESLPDALGAGAVPATPRTTEVEVSENFDSRWLPMPYPGRALRIDDAWAYDGESLNVFGVDHGTLGIDYAVDSLELAFEQAVPTGAAPPGLEVYTELPAGLPDLVRTRADEVTAGAATPMDKAKALQAYFRDGDEFTYSLEVDTKHNASDLVAFLTDRTGYCEQFAATMAIMARHVGIPARVNIGFTPGDNTTGYEWVVTSHDAHAWPELFIDGLGWVRFEPTPTSRTGQPAWSVITEEQPTPQPSTSATSSDSPTVVPTDREDVGLGVDAGSGGGFTFPVVPVLVVLGVALLLAVPMLARAAMTRRRWSRAHTPGEVVLAAWAIFKDRAADLGHSWDRTDTPRTLARRITDAAGLEIGAAEALGRLARATERVLYAREPGEAGDVQADLETVSQALTAAADRGRRLRARYLPPSTARITHAASEKVADGLDWVEGLGGALARIRSRRS